MNNSFFRPNWSAPINIHAIQTLRNGGFSNNSFESFNVSDGVGDNLLHVQNNMIKLNQILPQKPKWIKQIHSDICIELPSNDKEGDSLFTYQKNIVCAIRTADCLPILLTDDHGSFVACIHAGWKGLGLGVIENLINNIKPKGSLIVWLGPCISQSNFEVGLDVYDFIIKKDPRLDESFIRKDKKKFNLDLLKAAKIKLKNLGIENVTTTQNTCTYRDSDKFFSYRRDMNTGRMASLIWFD